MQDDSGPANLGIGAIVALLLAAAQTPLGSTMIAVALPAISETMATDIALTTSLLVTTYIIVTIVFQSPGGKLADMLGRWRVFDAGLMLFGIGALLGACGVALWMLVAARILTAIGGGLMGPAALAILRSSVAPARRGRIFGVYSAVLGLAAAIGPWLGGELTYQFGWRAIFVVTLPLILIAALLTRFAGRTAEAARRSQSVRSLMANFDWAGTLLLGAALVALGAARLWTVALGIGLAIAFVLWERRARDPLLSPALFANRVFAAGCIVLGFESIVMYGALFQLPQFFETLRGASPRETGHLLFVMMIGLFVASVVGGAFANRLGARLSAVCGVAAIAAGVIWLFGLPSMLQSTDAYGAVALIGIGLGLSWAPAQTSALFAADETQAGAAAGATTTSRYLGGAVGILSLGAVLGAGEPNVERHVMLLWLFVAALVVAGAAALVLPRRLRSPTIAP